MNGVKSALIRRKKKRAIEEKTKIMLMSANLCKKVGKFMAPAMKSSKKAMVPAARITMKIRKAASFLSELKMLANVILLLHYW